MIWDIHLQHRLGSGRSAFTLNVHLQSSAQRLLLLGPSGAGKSLTLRCIAGLDRPAHGWVRFQGNTMLDTARGIDRPPRQRALAYMFQDYALFPHLTVRQNVAFGLRRGWFNPGPKDQDPAVETWLERLELQRVQTLYPQQLSGGQRQRTALARALVAGPQALLLDEPFAALDPSLRQRLSAELADWQAQLGLPMIMISHDPADAERFGNEVLRIEHGELLSAPYLPHAA